MLGDTDAAVRTLLAVQPSNLLTKLGLASTLVALTEELMKRQPGAVLDESRRKLDTIPG
jgi:hypothetical protein